MKLKKVIVTVLVCVFALTMLVGCVNDGGGGATDSDTLNISIAELGYGTDWLEALAEAFTEKTSIQVKITSRKGSLGVSNLTSELESFESSADIIFNKFSSYTKYVYQGKVRNGSTTYDNLLADLSDVWNNPASDDETKTIAEKMNSAYTSYHYINGAYYGMPWAGGVFGIVRNVDIWDELGLTDEDVPLTTDELFALCDKVKSSYAPFIFSTEQSYYEAFMPIFMAQYEGSENYADFLKGLDPNGNYSENIYAYDGALEAMKVFEKLVNKSNGYQHDRSTIAFNLMQSLFLDQKQALFCVNGSWLETESSGANSTKNIDFIRTPVISSLINKLDTVNDDATLSAVIAYVDAIDEGKTATKPSGVSDEDIATVTDARHLSYIAGGIDHQAVVPSYGKNIENAKKFLRFMYSDEGLNIYYKALNGISLPAVPESSYDSTGVEISKFTASSNKASESYVMNREANSIYFAMGGVATTFNNGISVSSEIFNGNITAQGVIDKNNDYIKNRLWPTIKQYLGL